MTDYGTCPVCSGSGRVPAGDDPYKKIMYSYDETTDTLACCNCGGQYQWGRPTGKVRLRDDGTPCIHQYTSRIVGRCLTQYCCIHCDDIYEIDSGD